MPSQFAVGLRACCVAVALIFATAHAAEQKSSLIGVNRDEVLQRLGEPRGILTAGNREVITFDQQRVTLRDGIVVAVEAVAAEPARAPEPAPTPAAPPPTETAPAETTAPGAQPPATPATSETAQPAPTAAETPAPAPTTPPATRTAPQREPTLSIKSVRPPGSPRPAPKQLPAPAPRPQPTKQEPTAPAATPVPPSTAAVGQAEQATRAAATPDTTATAVPPPATPTPTPAQPTPTAPLPAVATMPAAPASAEPVVDPLDAKKAEEQPKAAEKAKAAPPRLRPSAEESAEPSLLTTKNIVIGLAVIAAGIGVILWLRRQRMLALAATSVSRTPFSTTTAAGSGARFNADLLGKLEWKRFEELVAQYYGKTGVVASRTGTGPGSPVQIKISWKGEPRPFAYVQCIPHPKGLIEAQPLQDLITVLAADDIRRGYVVTTGKFSVSARDLAEEKHLTLLPGDILLEKINALPDSARSEIMQEVTKGDYQTPTCPKCDAKMARSEIGLWRCAQHPDVIVPTAN